MSGPAPRIGVLVEDRYLAHREPAGTVDALRAAGHEVGLVVADRRAAALGAPSVSTCCSGGAAARRS